MRVAKRQNPQRRQTAVGRSIPAPVGGWDAYNPLASMPIQNAVILDNWIPRAGFVELRRGFVVQQTGIGPVETLMTYRGGASGDALFAAAGGHIYDVTVQNGVPSSVMAGATSNRWNYTAFANAAGAWLIAVNGADAPVGYNAGAWAALPALSAAAGPPALTPTTLNHVFNHKGRLHYFEKGTLHVWNPAAGAVGGACTLLDLSSIFYKGGRLICGASWSAEMGNNVGDFAVYMTDQGQVAIYQGTDPTSSTDWTLIGLYDLGPPIGSRALLKYGGDLVIVTADGVIPFSQAMKLDRADQNQVALTRQIMNAFSAAVKAYHANYGWQGVIYAGSSSSNDPEAAGGSLAIFNIPTSTLSTSMQYVQNVLTGSWCRFTGLDAFCWETANGNVFFGATGGVYQWDAGSSDNGLPVEGDVKGAFSDFGEPGRQKQFTMIRPILKTSPLVQPALEIDVDYRESTPTAVPTVVEQQGDAEIRYDWTGVAGIGYVGAPRMKVSLTGDTSTPTLGIGDATGDDLAINGSGDALLTQSGLPFDVPCQLLGFDLIYQRGALL